MKNMGEEIHEEMVQKNLLDDYEKLIGDSVNDPDVKKFLNEHANEIDAGNLPRSAARIYEYVQEKRKIANGKEPFAKGYLPELTVNNRAVDVAYVPDPETQRKASEYQFKKNFELIDLPADVRDAHLSDYLERNKDGRFTAYNAATKFLDLFATQKQFAPGLFLSGNYGVGKTYLLGAIANELAQQGYDVKLLHFPTFAGAMKDAIKDNSVLSKIDKVKKSSVLMLDDIGADSVSEWIRDEVLGVILQYRMQEQLPTFFSSNFTMEKLREHLAKSNKGDLAPVKADRIMERIEFLSREIIVSGENQRRKNQIEY